MCDFFLRQAAVHDFYCEWFLTLLERFDDVVVMVLSGHTHQDSWVDLGPFTQFITPSITPFSFKNPALRVYVTDEKYELLQIDTYVLDLGAANAKVKFEAEHSLSWLTTTKGPRCLGA